MSIQLIGAVSNWVFYIAAVLVVCAGVVAAVVVFSAWFKRVMD